MPGLSLKLQGFNSDMVSAGTDTLLQQYRFDFSTYQYYTQVNDDAP